MDLNALAAPLTRTITPAVRGVWYKSAGYTTGADGTQLPAYEERTVTLDMQSASSGDLRQLDALNIQNVQRVAYMRGNVEGINRVRGKGGDLVTVAAGPDSDRGTWLVAAVLEVWPDWCKVALTVQVDAP